MAITPGIVVRPITDRMVEDTAMHAGLAQRFAEDAAADLGKGKVIPGSVTFWIVQPVRDPDGEPLAFQMEDGTIVPTTPGFGVRFDMDDDG